MMYRVPAMMPARIPDLKLTFVFGINIKTKLSRTHMTQKGNSFNERNMAGLTISRRAIF